MPIRKFTKKEVIKLIQFYCEQQRFVCQLPTCMANDRFITKEENELMCKKIMIDANIERLMPLNKENFSSVLNRIRIIDKSYKDSSKRITIKRKK